MFVFRRVSETNRPATRKMDGAFPVAPTEELGSFDQVRDGFDPLLVQNDPREPLRTVCVLFEELPVRPGLVIVVFVHLVK